MYVADTNNHRIQVLHHDLTFWHMFGHKGSKSDKFSYPHGLAIDSQSALYVCDAGNTRIQKLSNIGNNISEFPMPSCPQHIAIDCNDLIYVTDNLKLFLYDRDGYHLGCADSHSKKGLAVDEQGCIYKCDEDSITVLHSAYH